MKTLICTLLVFLPYVVNADIQVCNNSKSSQSFFADSSDLVEFDYFGEKAPLIPVGECKVLIGGNPWEISTLGLQKIALKINHNLELTIPRNDRRSISFDVTILEDGDPSIKVSSILNAQRSNGAYPSSSEREKWSKEMPKSIWTREPHSNQDAQITVECSKRFPKETPSGGDIKVSFGGDTSNNYFFLCQNSEASAELVHTCTNRFPYGSSSGGKVKVTYGDTNRDNFFKCIGLEIEGH